MFITFEGIEGSGKTTQIYRTAEELGRRGHRCRTTREPGGTEIGAHIRSVLLNPENSGLDPVAELLLYLADRAHHAAAVIRPALASGEVVLCDRYSDATLAYQGYARGLDRGLIRRLHGLIMGDLRPDITVLLDLPVETGLRRALDALDQGVRNTAESRFEQESLAFHEKVRAGYRKMAAREPGRFRVVDADRSPDVVFSDIMVILSYYL